MTVIEQLKNREETVWLNDQLRHMVPLTKINGYGYVYLKAAQNRFMRFLPYVASAFPETAAKRGVIESTLKPIPAMADWMREQGTVISGQVFLKDDAHMPIAGSVKARGGIHEVMKIAEGLLQKEKLLMPTDNYQVLDSDEYRAFFSQYTIQVGSTGNLGLAIGRMAAKMGFRAIVHMSSDAKPWKKELLRAEGVIVREYDGDYSEAVAAGRRESEQDEKSFFIDDENSEDLFFGYSTAAVRLKMQLAKARVTVDEEHPLFLYLPCGVGGAPGGITWGMKHLYGDNVHCFFAEPVEAPCFTLGMASGKQAGICVQEIGLSGKTIADGLAVGRASALACKMMETLVSGSITVQDEKLKIWQKKMMELEQVRLEPSACAGFAGLSAMENSESFAAYLDAHELREKMAQATHIVWGTGGGLMPAEEV